LEVSEEGIKGGKPANRMKTIKGKKPGPARSRSALGIFFELIKYVKEKVKGAGAARVTFQ